MAPFPEADPARRDPALEAAWEPLIRVRGEVLKALEAVRQGAGKGGGSSLNYQVRLHAPDDLREKLAPLAGQMEDVFIVSLAELAPDGAAPAGAYASEEISGLSVEVLEAKGQKCAMSWKIKEDVGSDPRFPDLSARCAQIAAELLP